MSRSELILSVESVSKKFCKDLKKSLYYGLSDIARSTFSSSGSKLRKDEFWAVNDISFELRRGDCLGLVGHNGAGKSTLLKMINGIISPDSGSITIYGRTAALIELGAGFNPILSGRENIYNNGSVLGFTRKELNERIDSIIEFSEIQEFIDTPVQNYSSGMKVRLGFAVAAHLDPDLLLIDEVLAVGDVGFRIKCYNKIASLLETTAIVFVSHSMPQVAKISTLMLLLDRGKKSFQGAEVSSGIEAYYELFGGEELQMFGDGIELLGLKINKENAISNLVNCRHGEPLEIGIEYCPDFDSKDLRIGVQFFDKDLKLIATAFSDSLTASNGESSLALLTLERNEFNRGKLTVGLIFTVFSEKGIVKQIKKRYMGIGTLMSYGIEAVTAASFQLLGSWTQVLLESETED